MHVFLHHRYVKRGKTRKKGKERTGSKEKIKFIFSFRVPYFVPLFVGWCCAVLCSLGNRKNMERSAKSFVFVVCILFPSVARVCCCTFSDLVVLYIMHSFQTWFHFDDSVEISVCVHLISSLSLQPFANPR